jgi:hypothetical protein
MLNALCGVDRSGFIDDAFCAIHPYIKESFSDAMMTKFTPSINEGLYHKGRMGMINNIEVMTENAVYIHRTYEGARGTPVVGATKANGNTITISGLTASITGIIKANDRFKISASKKVIPLDKYPTLYSAQFVVQRNPDTEDGSYDSDSDGKCTVIVNPFDSRTTITVGNVAQVNPFKNIDRALTLNDPITFVGSHMANVVWLKPMLNLAFPPLKPLNKGAESDSHLDPDNKIWMRYSAQDFITDSQHTRRIDMRPGVLWRGELALIILSKIPTGL